MSRKIIYTMLLQAEIKNTDQLFYAAKQKSPDSSLALFEVLVCETNPLEMGLELELISHLGGSLEIDIFIQDLGRWQAYKEKRQLDKADDRCALQKAIIPPTEAGFVWSEISVLGPIYS